MVAPLALGFFAGVRTAELSRMTWERHVNLSTGLISITGDIAKKRSIRNIDLTPQLARWLTLAPSMSGMVSPQGTAWRTGLELVRQKAEVPRWTHNAMRHSFASYHLQHFGDAARTSLILGHRGGDDLLFEHYRTLTNRQAADQYWRILPPAEGALIRFPAASRSGSA